MKLNDVIKFSEYRDWLRDLKQQIRTGQIKAALSVNSQMIMLYWDLGRQITEKQGNAQWGSGFIEQLSKDLREEFPEMTGFSAYNLRFMRIFFKFYSSIWEQSVPKLENQIMKQLVPKLVSIPWGHHILILKKIKDINQALFYIAKAIENNWSRAVRRHCGLDPQSPANKWCAEPSSAYPQSPKERRMSKIWIGPCENREWMKESLEHYLKQKGLKIEVEQSKIPYRG